MSSSDQPALQNKLDRALGALYGAAIGDALGMPTQDLSPDVIAEDYGPITTFLPAGPNQVIAAGQPAGTITDDTEQMILVALALTQAGGFNPGRFAEELDRWEQKMKAKGSLDLLGPSTKAAIEAIRAGTPPERSGLGGTTNCAAMRAAPMGVACPQNPVQALVNEVVEVSQVTHNSAPAIAAAAAVAAGVSAGVSGSPLAAALRFSREVAELAEAAAPQVVGPSFTARWDWARRYLAGTDDVLTAAYNVVGTTVSSTESVVVALCLCELVEDPWSALCQAAEVGGDTDTIATIVGAILGAANGTGMFPAGAIDDVRHANDIDLKPLAENLLAVRAAAEARDSKPNKQ